jgi:AcrR family transcriptional regulator
MKQGRRLTLEEVAEGALVSRATADLYFSSVDARARRGTDRRRRPDREDLFRDVSVDDPIERLVRVESALHDMISANEPSLRLMLAHSLRRSLNGDPGDGRSVRTVAPR